MPRAPDAPGLLHNTKAIATIALVLVAFTAIALAIDNKSAPAATIAPTQTAAVSIAEDAFAGIKIAAKSAVVVDLKANKILYEHNPDIQLPLASLTKVPLAIVVSESLAPDSIIIIPRDTAQKGSAERLGKGERWSIKDIIDFTLVASSNAGAEILAEVADKAIRSRYPEAPKGQAALWRMNQLAGQLGLSHTYFLNPSGLDLSNTLSGAYGSARDVAVLFGFAASSYPSVFSGTSQNGLILTSANGNGKTAAYNTNEAIGDIPGLVMGKTGITDLAGGNLAVVFDVEPKHPVVAVVLGSTRDGRFSDMRLLVERTRKTLGTE